jgi:predicted DNA-binding transcriptional regulator AlpA
MDTGFPRQLEKNSSFLPIEFYNSVRFNVYMTNIINIHVSRSGLVSRKEVAKLAGVHPGTVKRWERRDKVLTPIRINSRVVRYNKAEVEKLLGGSDDHS